MTIEGFRLLDMNARATVVWDNGKQVDVRAIYNKYKIIIYSVFNFYVEVYYSVKDNKIEEVKLIDEEKDWEGYLKSISLDKLIR